MRVFLQFLPEIASHDAGLEGSQGKSRLPNPNRKGGELSDEIAFSQFERMLAIYEAFLNDFGLSLEHLNQVLLSNH